MAFERPPLRLLKIIVITAILLAAIAVLFPDEPQNVHDAMPDKALASTGGPHGAPAAASR